MQSHLGLFVFVCVCVSFGTAHVLKTRSVRYFVNADEKVSWLTALHKCERENQRFAQILSNDDSEHILGIITRNDLVDETFWVAGTDLRSKGLVQWVSEPNEHFIPAAYTYWLPNQPHSNRHQGCLQIVPLDYQWRITNCNELNYYICEQDD